MARRSSQATPLRAAPPPGDALPGPSSSPRLRASAPRATTALHAPDGARVELAGEAIEVFDPAGRLMIRYRDGALEVSPAQGDLVLASATGRVRIAAATDVVVEAARDLCLSAQRGLEASAGATTPAAEAGDADAAPQIRGSRLALDPRRVVLATATLDVRARTAHVAAGDATVLARRIRTTATQIATTVEELEVTAGHVVERARDVVQEVSGVLTSRLGRVRAVVKDVYSLRARRTELKSKEDTAIDGRRVLLG